MTKELTIIKQPENWIHYSSSSIQIVMETRYQQNTDRQTLFFKPKGLWVTPEYANYTWFDWCMDNKFREEELNFIHDVKIKSDAKLLRLENAEDIDKFTAEYGVNILSEIDPRYRRTAARDGIRWDEVAKSYQGILIPNYIWERRLFMGTNWYYSWDCSSGCIWDVNAVESIAVRSTESAGRLSTPQPSIEHLFKKVELETPS